jgi:hypothetical protein
MHLELKLADSDYGNSQWGVGEVLRLQLSYWPEKPALVSGNVRLKQGSLSLEYGFLCYGYDLQQFADSLSRLHATESDRAEFINQAGNIEIVITLVDPASGGHEVSVRLEQIQQSPFAGADDFDLSRHNYRGFGIDQSYLPGMAASIMQFLRTWNISVVHPMMEA